MRVMRGLLRSVRSLLGVAADSLQVLQFLFTLDGFWAAVLTALQTWVAKMLDAPPYLIAPLAVFMFGSVLFLFNQLQVLRDRRARLPGPPDYGLYDRQDEFSVWDAACLWDEKPITASALTERGLFYMRRIKQAGEDGRIVLSGANASGNFHRGSRVTREQLRALAGIVGERPKFLYPDAR